MNVVVCGAGIAGLTLAHRLSSFGNEVVLIERASGPRAQGYMIDFFGPGYDALEAMGLLPAVKGIAYHLDEASLLDERGRRRTGVRPEQFANGPLLDLMRPDLERVLLEQLPPDVDLRFDATLAGVSDHGDHVHVELADGSTLDADLLVGADGIHSTVRNLAFGPEHSFVRYLGFHTAAFLFDEPQVYAAVRDRACLTDTIDRQMGFYGLRDGRVAAFAVHRTADPALPDNVRSAVRATYGGLGWLVPTALDRCPPSSEIYYDQVAQVVMPTWSRGRVVLVGDASCAVSLIAGQGASLAVAGAYVLADRLVNSESVDEALVDYETAWRPVAEEKQRVGRSGARWFLPRSRSQLWLRRAMLRLARLPVLDRYLATALVGKSTPLVMTSRP